MLSSDWGTHVGATDIAVGVVNDLNFVGESPAFAEVLRFIDRVSRCEAAVLLQGETGTGKELAARAIHYLSARRGGPFIPVNCGALPDSLVESELFGHVQGAFTDAKKPNQGLIGQACSGTLFLDELETMSPRGQVALLRFLQNQEYRPVGGGSPKTGDVRVIGASNADLASLARRGEFRPDLVYRLNILICQLPPLRAREADVVLLAKRFLDRYCRHYHKPHAQLSPRAINALQAYCWPGNVRELDNLIHREVVLSDAPLIHLVDLQTPPAPGAGDPPTGLSEKPFREAKARAIASFEKAYIAELLVRTGGNISLAARLCGKDRSRLQKLVTKHGLLSRRN
ncbi:MAG: sigma-54 interaction domain-containing protein [Gammaproteobacteria bacterium]